MKILTAKQTQEADAYTIKNEPIKSIDLMERASLKCVDWLINKYNQNTQFAIFCGVGNNGGDGLAIARLLLEHNYKLEVFIVDFSNQHTEDFKINLERLQQLGIKPTILSVTDNQFQLDKKTVVIDAIFGSGLSRPIEGFISEIVNRINQTQCEIVAIDMPSGLFCDESSNNTSTSIIKANYTLTFQQPKLAQLYPENYKYVGEFFVIDIGLHPEFLKSIATNNFFVTKDMVKSGLHNRKKFSHKGSFGHAFLIAGSEGMMGAEILAARACLRTGIGRLTIQLPKAGLSIMQTAVPEAMCITDDADKYITTLMDISTYDAVGVGPGLGKNEATQLFFKLLIQQAEKPLVIDADALNILSENKTWISFLPPLSILTPHPKEFERLVGNWNNDEEKLEKQKNLSSKNNLIIVLKGANTAIAMPSGNVYFNSTGNPGMSTAGSGDVLTGVITSLLAQSYSPEEAAIYGVFLHGLAGDFAKEKVGVNAIIASDIVDSLPSSFKSLEN